MNAIFLAAPHRVMFFGGAVQSILAIAFWAVDLGARYAGLYAVPSWPFPSIWLHALLMLYGVFSFFVFGFLMTALPKWVGGTALERRRYLPSFLLMAAGWATFYLALRVPALIAFSLLLVAVGWCWGWWSLLGAARLGANQDKRHAWAALAALGVGVPGLLAFAAGLRTGDSAWVRLAIECGLWGVLLPLFVTVSHRMLPFFSSMVIPRYKIYRSMPLLWVLLACFAAHALGAGLGRPGWVWPSDALAAGVALFLSWKWQVHRSFAEPLVAMHHVATLWLGAGLALYAVQGGLGSLGIGWGGLAPLHALGIGYCASMLLGMATRVTLGHSGQAPVADRWTWGLFWALQGVAALRLAGDFLSFGGAGNLFWLAALGWLAVFGIWCRLYLPIYLKPRSDGVQG